MKKNEIKSFFKALKAKDWLLRAKALITTKFTKEGHNKSGSSEEKRAIRQVGMRWVSAGLFLLLCVGLLGRHTQESNNRLDQKEKEAITASLKMTEGLDGLKKNISDTHNTGTGESNENQKSNQETVARIDQAFNTLISIDQSNSSLIKSLKNLNDQWQKTRLEVLELNATTAVTPEQSLTLAILTDNSKEISPILLAGLEQISKISSEKSTSRLNKLKDIVQYESLLIGLKNQLFETNNWSNLISNTSQLENELTIWANQEQNPAVTRVINSMKEAVGFGFSKPVSNYKPAATPNPEQLMNLNHSIELVEIANDQTKNAFEEETATQKTNITRRDYGIVLLITLGLIGGLYYEKIRRNQRKNQNSFENHSIESTKNALDPSEESMKTAPQERPNPMTVGNIRDNNTSSPNLSPSLDPSLENQNLGDLNEFQTMNPVPSNPERSQPGLAKNESIEQVEVTTSQFKIFERREEHMNEIESHVKSIEGHLKNLKSQTSLDLDEKIKQSLKDLEDQMQSLEQIQIFQSQEPQELTKFKESMEAVYTKVSYFLENLSEVSKISDELLGISEKINVLAIQSKLESSKSGTVNASVGILSDALTKLAHESETSTKKLDLLIENSKSQSEDLMDQTKVGQSIFEKSLETGLKMNAKQAESQQELTGLKNKISALSLSLMDKDARINQEVDQATKKVEEIKTNLEKVNDPTIDHLDQSNGEVENA